MCGGGQGREGYRLLYFLLYLTKHRPTSRRDIRQYGQQDSINLDSASWILGAVCDTAESQW